MIGGMSNRHETQARARSVSRRFPLRVTLLAVWFVASFGGVFFARDLQFSVAGWPFSFWFSAQGSVILFVAIVALYAWLRNRRGDTDTSVYDAADYARYKRRLHRWLALYILGLAGFLALLFWAERAGLTKPWMGAIFLFSTIGLYAVIGIYNRTSDPEEYYVAGRRIPAMYNGMATAADWMSAASFISLAGGLYLQGYSGTEEQPGGLAYVLGWTGGFCLVALLIAPYLRSMSLYTVPDFFGERFGGNWPRRIAALAAVMCSFTYVVAQIYGVGLITARLTGVEFEIGILLGLGGVLLCSFLGGMRAVTWTQVAQYVIVMLAFLIPVSWLAYKQLGNPLAPLVYGQQLEKIDAMERALMSSPTERQVTDEYGRRAREFRSKLDNVEVALAADRRVAQEHLRRLNAQGADADMVFRAGRELALLPKDVASAREHWTRAMRENQERSRPMGGMPPHAKPFAGDPDGTPQQQQTFDNSRRNFLALVFCLMVGTTGLPHLLTRFYTTPTVAEARTSVAWSILFIALLYLAAPALAVLVKYEVMSHLVGLDYSQLPGWLAQWAKVDPGLLSVNDINGDHVLQFAELKLGADIVMLVSPELGGMPYIVSGLVAAGGLAAALSTADGLLLTIGNALAHDLYFRDKDYRLSAMQRVMLSKFALLLVALSAAYAAAQKPADILFLVAASFSMAASAFVPVMVLGIFWARTTRAGAVAGMLTGLGVAVYYMIINSQGVRATLELSGNGLWFEIQPISAGVFGVPAGVAAAILVSLLFQSGAAHGTPHGVEPEISQH